MKLSDDEAASMVVAANAVTSALTDVAEWLKPDSVTAASMTLAEMVHARIIASATLSAEGKVALDEVIEHSREHMTELAQFYYAKLKVAQP
jgi:hypothetical protein